MSLFTSSIRCVVSVALILLATAPSIAQNQAANPPSQQNDAITRGGAPGPDEAVLNTLQATIVDADYSRIDLEKVIDDLRQKHNLNVHMSWPALEAVGIRRDLRIEVHLKRVSLATLLEIVLREAGSAAQSPPTYHVQDGVLIITTGDGRREDTILRTYDIADLMQSGYAIRRFANTPVLGLELTGREFVGGEQLKDAEKSSGGGRGGGGSASLFGDPKGEPGRVSSMERAQGIVDLLTETIESESWQTSGGAIGSVRLFGSTLLISHTMRVHQRIAEFFNMLRAIGPESLDGEAIVLRIRADKASAWRQQVGPEFPRLSSSQVDELVKASDAGGVLFHGSTSGFNGQGMLFSALTQRDVLTGSNAVVAQDSSAYTPVSGTATSGLELILLPLLSPRSDDLTVDVQMAWVPNVQVSARPVTLGPVTISTTSGAGPLPSNSTIDQATRSMRTVSSTTKVKLGEAIAFSIPTELNAEGQSVEWEDWLIVRVHRPGA